MTGPRWVVLACAGVMLTGCAQVTAGAPVPVAASRSTPPERPREIRLDGRDACALAAPSDLARIGMDVDRPGKAQQNRTFKSPECLYDGRLGGGRITLVMTEGAEAWTRGGRNADVTDTAPIERFPAIQVLSRADPNRCDTVVDVADGQYVLTTVIKTDPEDTSIPDKCEIAHRLAESAMRTLVRQQ